MSTELSIRPRRLGFVLLLLLALAGASSCTQEKKEPPVVGTKFDDIFKLPELPAPSRYGNVLIDRLTRKSTHPPVAFSHWLHRRNFTCRVCHFELNFAMKTNGTDITEEKNRKGEYCGACHNGKTAFGHTDENCLLCHTGNIGASDYRFGELKDFPKTLYGDQINWSKALKMGIIKPKQSILDEGYESIPFDKKLRLSPEWRGVKTRASFPHQKHTDWLDCADCHPDIFNIQQKGTKHFRMDYIVSGKFCGVCHLNVSFPVQDCRRCHPDLR